MKVSCPSVNIVKCNVLNKKFPSFLSEEYISNVKDKVSLNVLPDAKPTFVKARTVPIRL